MATLAEKLRKSSASKGTLVPVDGLDFYVNFPPLSRFQIAQERAELSAMSELEDIKEQLLNTPIKEEEYKEAIKGYEGDPESLPQKPANRYEQRLEQERNSRFMFLIGPFMLFDEEGNPAAKNAAERKTLQSAIESSPDLIKTIADKMKEFGEAMQAKTEDKKK